MARVHTILFTDNFSWQTKEICSGPLLQWLAPRPPLSALHTCSPGDVTDTLKMPANRCSVLINVSFFRCAVQLSVAQLALAASLVSLSSVTTLHPIFTILFHLPSPILVPQRCPTCPCCPSRLRPLPSHYITPHLHYPVSPALPRPCSSPVEPSHGCLVSQRRHQTMCSPTKFHHPCLTIDSISRLVIWQIRCAHLAITRIHNLHLIFCQQQVSNVQILELSLIRSLACLVLTPPCLTRLTIICTRWVFYSIIFVLQPTYLVGGRYGMGALDPRTKMCTLYRLLLTPSYREGEEIYKYLAAIFEVDTHECFKTHNEVTSALIWLCGRNRFVEDLSAWPLEAISVYDS